MDKAKSRAGIRTKLFWCMIIFTLLTVFMLWLCQNMFFEEIYRHNKINDVKSAANEIISNSQKDDFREKAIETAKEYSVCLRIEAKNKTFQPVDADVANGCIIHHIPPYRLSEIFNKALNSEDGILYLSDDEHGERDSSRIILAASIKHKNDVANIIIDTVVVPVGSTVETMNTILVFVSLIMILLSLILTLILSRMITRPIEAITEGARQLALGDYSHSFVGGGSAEIVQLAQTLNYAKSELKKTDTLQKELIANISHDIRTPLTMISGYSQMMRDLPGENTDENLQIIIDETERLSTLVTDVLDLSKLKSGTEPVLKEATDLGALAADVISSVSRSNNTADISLFCENETTAECDSGGARRVIYNLVSNAVHHTDENGSIAVNVARIDNYIRVSVADTGKGIPADKLKDIWERYYKAESTIRPTNSTGLGLSIVKEIMLQHGGYYGVSSTVGEGSLFWVDFPITTEKTEDN